MLAIPHGKALFVRQWATIGGGDNLPAGDWLTRYRAAGFQWAAPLVQSGNGATRRVLNRSSAHWRAMRDAGLQAWGTWLLPDPGPGSLAEDAADLAAFVSDSGGTGLLIDPEAAFKNEPEAAEAFGEACRNACDAEGIGYAVTSYSRPRFHRSFPWREFAEGADFGLAQTYDRDLAFDSRYFGQAVSEWQSRGFLPTFPCAGLWAHSEDRPKTPAEVRRHLALVPARARAVCVWPTPTIGPAVWAELSDWRTGNSGGGAGVGLALLAMAGTLAAMAVGKG